METRKAAEQGLRAAQAALDDAYWFGRGVEQDDAEAGKQTFVSLLGADRAREQARMLVEQAVEHLAQHGREADLLRAVAHYIVERDH